MKNIKFFLMFAIFILLGVVLSVFIGYRTDSNPQEFVQSPIQDDATVSIGKVHHTSTKNGIKEWTLNATSASFIEKNKQAVFKNLSVVFYASNGSEIHLTADKGILNTATNDIHIRGNVVADDGHFRIQTDNLSYEHKRRVLTASKPVQVLGSAVRLYGKTALFDLNSQKAVFGGKVEGIIFENIAL